MLDFNRGFVTVYTDSQLVNKQGRYQLFSNTGHILINEKTPRVMLFLGIFVLVGGCSKETSCNSSITNKNYAQAAKSCQVEFNKTGKSAYLSSWIRALYQLGQFNGIDQAIKSIENDIKRADAMVVAARFMRKKQTQKAQEYLQQSVKIYERVNAPTKLAKSQRSLSTIAWRKSNHREALKLASASLNTARSVEDSKSEVAALRVLFNIFEEVGHVGASEYSLSLIEQKLENDQTSPYRIDAYINRGLLQMRDQQFGLASHNFDLALAAAKGSTNKSALRGLHLNIVHVNLELGRIEKASKHLDTAFSYANEDGSVRYALLYYQAKLHYKKQAYQAAYQVMSEALQLPDLPPIWKWEMHYWAGMSARNFSDDSEAVDSFNQAIVALEDMREEIKFSDLKAHLLSEKRKPYEALFIEHVNSGNLKQALAISEQAKTRSFIEQYIENTQDIDFPGKNTFEVDGLADRIENLQDYLFSMQTSSVTEVQKIDDVLKHLKEQRVLSYFLAEKQLYIINVSSNNFEIKKADISFNELTQLFHDYREAPDDRELLTQLGKALLPIEYLPEQGEHLFISPDSFLADIAVASLLIQSQHLIERHSLSMIPSASSLLTIKQEKLTIKAKQHVVIGDPGGDLSSAREEAQRVAEQLDSQAFTGNNANYESMTKINEPDILHIASHSGVNHLGPWIRLANGDISATSFMRANLKPKLAVLASCNSGVSMNKNLWGSLGGMFLSNGTSSALASLWSVDDDTTQQIILDFYQFLLQDLSPSIALAKAQRLGIKRGLSTNKWAAFIVLGDVSSGSL